MVVGIDSYQKDHQYLVYSHTGNPAKTKKTKKETMSWAKEAEDRGAGEIVLNCMNQDGVRNGYDIEQLKMMRLDTSIPLIASGGAGKMDHFRDVFHQSNVSGALAASVFHKSVMKIIELKKFLRDNDIEVRL